MANSELTKRLTPLAMQLGGMAYVNNLSSEVIKRVVMHQDDTVALGTGQSSRIELYSPNLVEGYKVYSSDYKLIYSGRLTDNIWGKNKEDLRLIALLSPGDYVYLQYKTKELVFNNKVIEPSKERIILLVRV